MFKRDIKLSKALERLCLFDQPYGPYVNDGLSVEDKKLIFEIPNLYEYLRDIVVSHCESVKCDRKDQKHCDGTMCLYCNARNLLERLNKDE